MVEIDHIALIVSKEENLTFYEKLGFREKERFQRPYDKVVFMENGDVTLEIFVDPNHPNRASKPEANGLRHLAFTVDDFDKILDEFNCEPARTDFFGRQFTLCKDPDGQPIAFFSRQ